LTKGEILGGAAGAGIGLWVAGPPGAFVGLGLGTLGGGLIGAYEDGPLTPSVACTPGQQAQVKIDTFNFTHYGLLHGKVISVSHDAIVCDKPQDKTNPTKSQTALPDTSEPQGQEFVYAAQIALQQTQIEVEGRMVELSPGMAATVEIKTGSRRVIEYLLSLRYRQESLRER
jgi:multidrug efflux pump subunit AcrA (membrane-fusion protein)